jgi:hypothetical protein
MGIASVTAISCSHMLHYIKLCLWGATIRLILSLNSHMSTVALWSATRDVTTERRKGEDRDDPELQNEYNLTF